MWSLCLFLKPVLSVSQSKLEWFDSSCGIYAKMKTFQAQRFPAHDNEDITKLLGKTQDDSYSLIQVQKPKKKKKKNGSECQ